MAAETARLLRRTRLERDGDALGRTGHFQPFVQRPVAQFIGEADAHAIHFGPAHGAEHDIAVQIDLALRTGGQGATHHLRAAFAQIDDDAFQTVEHSGHDNGDVYGNTFTAALYLHIASSRPCIVAQS